MASRDTGTAARRGVQNHPIRVLRARLGQPRIRQVHSHLTSSLGDLIWISIVPTLLLAGWLIAIFRAAKDYDRPSPGATPERLPDRTGMG